MFILFFTFITSMAYSFVNETCLVVKLTPS